MAEIAKEEEEWVYAMFDRAVNEEKRWADYLFKDGSMIGLNDTLLKKYVEWVANRRLKSIGMKQVYDVPAKNNPLPGLNTGFPLRVSRLHLKKQKLNLMLLGASNKMLKKTHSLDLNSNGKLSHQET